MRISSVGAVLFSLSVVVGCGSPPAPAAPTPPVVAEAPPEPEAEEPETEPVVAAPPKNLEIQRNVIRLKPGIKILFETDSAKLVEASYEILDEVASVLEQNGRLRIRVEGHTDATGKEAYNKELSAKRAASVRDYLVQRGVADDRLASTGCGQTVPVAANDTDDGRQQNRRVEFVILRKRRQIEECQVYRPREWRKRDGAGTAGETPASDAPAPATP